MIKVLREGGRRVGDMLSPEDPRSSENEMPYMYVCVYIYIHTYIYKHSNTRHHIDRSKEVPTLLLLIQDHWLCSISNGGLAGALTTVHNPHGSTHVFLQSLRVRPRTQTT